MPLIVLSLEEMPLAPALEARWLAELPAARRVQLQGWPDADARRRSLWGSRLLRQGLLGLGYPSDALGTLRYSTEGRPSLALALDFSLAHCAGRLLCAISTEGPVGVDIEALGELREMNSGLYLSDDERAWIGRDARRFYALWTRKEAVLKAGGRHGLRQMREFEMSGEQTEFGGHRWHTTPLDVGKAHVAHLAHAQCWPALPVTRIETETLL